MVDCVAQRTIQLFDPFRRLIDQHDRSLVPRKIFSDARLIVPGEAALRIGGELDVVRRVGVDEIVRCRREFGEVDARELPVANPCGIRREVASCI